MPEKKQADNTTENKRGFFDYVFEIIGWLQIVASLLLLGLIVGAIIYFPNPGTLRLVIAIFIAMLGLIIGIALATKAWKGKGTMHLVSRDMATPELDNLEDDKK